MNKHLNNWLDDVEGKPKNTTNNAITKEMERQGYKPKKLNKEEMELLKKCDGVHGSLEEICNCESCSVILK